MLHMISRCEHAYFGYFIIDKVAKYNLCHKKRQVSELISTNLNTVPLFL